MPDCKFCKEMDDSLWKNHYMKSQQRFDKVVAALTIGTIIAYTITILCLIATICVIVKFQAFIEGFEYVEETEYEITQDDGINTAIIDGQDNEVSIYGTINNQED